MSSWLLTVYSTPNSTFWTLIISCIVPPIAAHQLQVYAPEFPSSNNQNPFRKLLCLIAVDAANPKTKSGDGHLKLKIRALKDPREPASYLKLWNTERSLWKFNKNLQNWLLTNMYDASKVCPVANQLSCWALACSFWVLPIVRRASRFPAYNSTSASTLQCAYACQHIDFAA